MPTHALTCTCSIVGGKPKYPSSAPQHKLPGNTPLGYPSLSYFPALGPQVPTASSKFSFSVDLPYDDIHSSDTESHMTYGSLKSLSGLGRTASIDQSQSKQGKPGLITSVLETFGRKKRLSIFPISHSELIDRFKRFMTTAVDLFVYTGK